MSVNKICADVGIRVNLSSSQTFADLVLALGRTLQLAHKHGHFPFGTVAEEVAMANFLLQLYNYTTYTHLGWTYSWPPSQIFLLSSS